MKSLVRYVRKVLRKCKWCCKALWDKGVIHLQKMLNHFVLSCFRVAAFEFQTVLCFLELWHYKEQAKIAFCKRHIVLVTIFRIVLKRILSFSYGIHLYNQITPFKDNNCLLLSCCSLQVHHNDIHFLKYC